MKARSKKSVMVLAVLTCIFAHVQADAQGLQYEPTVSRPEAELLRAAEALAETNALAAVEYLTKRTKPESSAALDFALGNFHYQNEDFEQAVAAYRQALDKLPLFRSALGNLGRVYLMLDQPGQAIEIYRTLVENAISSADNYLLLGQAHLMLANYISAENAFRQTLLLRPHDHAARLGLAKTLLQQERHRECRALLDELLAEDASSAELWELRSNLALALDQPEQALTSIESARRIGLASPEMLATLGDIYLNRQQPDDAVAAYEESFAARAPSFERIIRTVEALLASGRPEQAEALLEQAQTITAASESAENIRILELQAAIAGARGLEEQAQAIYRSILAAEPLNGRALIALAELEWRAGQLEQALMNCERAARCDAYEARALVLQGQIEVDRGNYRTALGLLERAQSFRSQEHVQRYIEQVRRLAD